MNVDWLCKKDEKDDQTQPKEVRRKKIKNYFVVSAVDFALVR